MLVTCAYKYVYVLWHMCMIVSIQEDINIQQVFLQIFDFYLFHSPFFN